MNYAEIPNGTKCEHSRNRFVYESGGIANESEFMYLSDVSRGLISGFKGSLKRVSIGPYSMVAKMDAKDGLKSLEALPETIHLAAANAVASVSPNRNNE